MLETSKGKVCPRLSGVVVVRNAPTLHEVICIEHRCAYFQPVFGKHPQTDEMLNHYDCAIRLHTMLLLENTKAVREGSDEVSAFREDTRTAQAAFSRSMLVAAARAIPMLNNEADK